MHDAVDLARQGLVGHAHEAARRGDVLPSPPVAWVTPSELATLAYCPEAHRLRHLRPDPETPLTIEGTRRHAALARRTRRARTLAPLRRLLGALLAAAILALLLYAGGLLP